MAARTLIPPLGWHVRPAAGGDLDGLVELAQAADAGMINLPRDRGAMAARLARSNASFAAELSAPRDELYLLVLDDGEGAVLGTACIASRVGEAWPFYTFQRTRIVHDSRELGCRHGEDLLQLNNQLGGLTEVGGLFLHPDARLPGAGRLLARSRYMLIAAAPQRFHKRVIAELRGWVDDGGHVPFWQAVGRRFFHMTLAEADHYNAVNGNQFIADLMPRYPIYVSLLSDQAQAAIGQVHPASAPALRLLEQEGFDATDHVDIFDAGPVLACARDALRAVREVHSSERTDAPALVARGPFAQFRCHVQAGQPDDTDWSADLTGTHESLIHAPF